MTRGSENFTESIVRLGKIEAALLRIRTDLMELMDKTSNETYRIDCNRDIANVSELIITTNAIRSDIESETISSCTKLVVQNAPSEFGAKLMIIPGNNATREKIIKRIKKIKTDFFLHF